MNATEYSNACLSANEAGSDLLRAATTIEDFETEVRELVEVEEDHIRSDAEQMKADDYYEAQLKDED